MNEIADYERRIGTALERIGRGLAALGDGPARPLPEGEVAGLRDALESERTANAQLTERVRAIKEKQETIISQLEKRLARLTQQLDINGLELQRQKRMNGQLRESNKSLREAVERGLSDPHLINKSMLVELEAMRAARASEMAEMEEILQELKPLIGEDADA